MELNPDIIRHQFIFLIVTLGLFYFAKVIKNVATPYDINSEIHRKNLAAAISLVGYFLASMAIFIGAFIGPSQGLMEDLKAFVGYAVLGIVLLNLSRIINDKLILRHFSNVKEISVDQNAGTGAVEFGSYLASGLVIAGAVFGEGGGVHTALITFALAQVILILYTYLYNIITPFDLHQKIEEDNVAVGVAFGGHLTAMGIILLRAGGSDFTDWKTYLTGFFVASLSGMVLLPVLRFVLDHLFFRNFSISDETAVEGNIGVGLLEATMSICFASLLFFLLDFG